MPTQYGGLGGGRGSSPYQYNIIRPPGGVNEVGSQYTDMDRDYFGEFMDAYRSGKERRKAERLQAQEQAMKISEMLGSVPPELEDEILGPIQPDDPTLGERALGGLGRLVGIDTEMGLQPEQFEIPEGGKLSTQYERDVEKSQREAATAASKEEMRFLRGLIGKKYQSDLNVQEKKELFNQGLWNPSLSYAQRIELIHEKERAKKKAGTVGGRKQTAKEKLKDDLYTGRKTLEDLDDADFLILDKFWSSMTPEARAEDALSYAENLVSSYTKGKIPKPTEEEINQMVDRMAEQYVQKQNDLIGKMGGKGSRRGKGGTSRSRADRLNQIMNAQ